MQSGEWGRDVLGCRQSAVGGWRIAAAPQIGKNSHRPVPKSWTLDLPNLGAKRCKAPGIPIQSAPLPHTLWTSHTSLSIILDHGGETRGGQVPLRCTSLQTQTGRTAKSCTSFRCRDCPTRSLLVPQRRSTSSPLRRIICFGNHVSEFSQRRVGSFGGAHQRGRPPRASRQPRHTQSGGETLQGERIFDFPLVCEKVK
jgi:hypothetical protein